MDPEIATSIFSKKNSSTLGKLGNHYMIDDPHKKICYCTLLAALLLTETIDYQTNGFFAQNTLSLLCKRFYYYPANKTWPLSNTSTTTQFHPLNFHFEWLHLQACLAFKLWKKCVCAFPFATFSANNKRYNSSVDTSIVHSKVFDSREERIWSKETGKMPEKCSKKLFPRVLRVFRTSNENYVSS